MARRVFFSVTMSLDGFIAPEERTDQDVQHWMAQWMELQQWLFHQRFFRENLKLRAEPTQRATHLSYAVRER